MPYMQIKILPFRSQTESKKYKLSSLLGDFQVLEITCP